MCTCFVECTQVYRNSWASSCEMVTTEQPTTLPFLWRFLCMLCLSKIYSTCSLKPLSIFFWSSSRYAFIHTGDSKRPCERFHAGMRGQPVTTPNFLVISFVHAGSHQHHIVKQAGILLQCVWFMKIICNRSSSNYFFKETVRD
uniref:Uncharacterized protein n=1 Tax=Rhipicephalus microplus TaxID=6941 RepID=A0A6G5AG09_RHIMP